MIEYFGQQLCLERLTEHCKKSFADPLVGTGTQLQAKGNMGYISTRVLGYKIR